MQTLKIKYTTDAQSSDMIREYRKQYSSVLHYAYNRRVVGRIGEGNRGALPILEQHAAYQVIP